MVGATRGWAVGDRYEAADLARLGVAWCVVPGDRLDAEALAVAQRLAGLPPLALRAMKRVLTATASTDLARALGLETDATVAGFLDPETTRRISDF